MGEKAIKRKDGKFAHGLRELKKQRDLQLMVIPGIIFLLIFSYIPMYGVIIAFKDYNFYEGIMGSKWVGLKHFKAFFSDPDLMNLFKNTVGISVLKTITGFPGPIIFALLLNEIASPAYKKAIQTMSYLPHFISIVVVAGMVMKFSSANGGLFNEILLGLHIIDEPISFLSKPDYFWGILASINVWQNIGWGSIIYCSAISGIDQELYEAATLDGAGRFKKMLHVTLPGMLPIITIYLILSISSLLTGSGFDDIILLRNNLTMKVADTISVYSYEMGLQKGRYSFATAIGLFTSVVNLILLVSANYISKKVSENSLW